MAVRAAAWAFLGLVVLLAGAEARFADSQGFSGKHGVDCGTCHGASPVELGSPVRLSFEGLPGGWSYGVEYPLRIRVDGGPPANPVPGQPQAGFDLETDAGSFSEGPGMSGLLRFPNPQEATYTGAGTLRREWSVVWKAPDLPDPPRTVRFWLAGLAANGNHLMNGPDTAGERGDRNAKIHVTLDASDDARREWLNQPLPPPVIDPLPPVVDPARRSVLVTGRVPDHADGADWSLDESEWWPAMGAPAFFFQLPPLTAGPHLLDVRTVWGERVSEPTRVEFRVPESGIAPAAQSPEGESAWPLLGLLVLSALLLSPLVLRLRR